MHFANNCIPYHWSLNVPNAPGPLTLRWLGFTCILLGFPTENGGASLQMAARTETTASDYRENVHCSVSTSGWCWRWRGWRGWCRWCGWWLRATSAPFASSRSPQLWLPPFLPTVRAADVGKEKHLRLRSASSATLSLLLSLLLSLSLSWISKCKQNGVAGGDATSALTAHRNWLRPTAKSNCKCSIIHSFLSI